MNKILIVEDEAIVARDIRQQLKLLNYEPVAATATGEEALVLADRLRPDLVLMDIQLAGVMDGIIAAQTIRERFDIPVVFLTAFAGYGSLQRAKIAEPFGYILKPLEERELEIVITIALYKHQADKEIRLANRQLEAKEERFNQLARQSRTSIWEVDADGVYTYCSQVFTDLVGYSVEEIIGKMHFYDLRPEEAREDFKRASSELFAGKSPIHHLDSPIQTKDGRTLWVSTTGIPILDNGGKLLGYHGSDTDITQRKQAEDALKTGEEIFSKLFHNSPVMMSLSSMDEGRYIDVNEAFASISGYSREEILRSTLTSIGLIGAADIQRLMAKLRSDKRASGFELAMTAKGGREIQCLFNAEIVHIQNRPCLLSVALDTTELKILHGQFMQSQKIEAVGQLAGGVAHDFNNILSVMLMLLNMNRTNTNKDWLIELENEVKRAASLTRQLLIFSRKEAKQTRSVQLNEVIRNLLKMLRRLLEENITIDLRLDPQLALIEADIGMMEQVLTNLCINARDAMLHGGVLLIKTENVELSDANSQSGTECLTGRHVRLTVSDTGCGMDQKVIARIFEPFFTTKEADKGTGLGLVTVQDIVRQHLGTMQVTSQLGLGSSFTIHLPASKSSNAQTLTTRCNDIPPAGGNETVLLAEDDISVRRITSMTLRQYGYDVLEAADGQQALAIWKEKHGDISLLLADMVMPGGLSGLDLAAKLREDKPGIKVMFTTGYALEANEIYPYGGASFTVLKKPYETPALIASVRQCLGL
jgi:PAS domain S-box-containing protein